MRPSLRAFSLLEVLIVAGLVAVIGNVISLSINFFYFQTARWENQKIARVVVLEHIESIRPNVFTELLDEVDIKKVESEGRIYRILTTISPVAGTDTDKLRELKVRCEWEGRKSGFYEKRARLAPPKTSSPANEAPSVTDEAANP